MELKTKPKEVVKVTSAAKVEAKPTTKTESKPKAGGKLAVVLIRGRINVNPSVRKTFDMLNLEKKHVCIILDDTPSNRGMLTKVKDYVTWGEINVETLKELQTKRGQKDKKHFNLHPPRGGFEKKGIKTSFQRGGSIGYRKDKINDLVRKML